MDPKACVTLQLVQSLPQRYRHSPKLCAGANVPTCSLLTAAVFGLYVNSLVRTHAQAVAENDDDIATINSLHLSLQGSSSSMQLSLAVKLSEDTTPPPSLPNLVTNSSRLEAVLNPCPGLCSLLEAGCVSPSFTVATKFVTLEVSHRAVLTWEHVLSHPLEGSMRKTTCQQQEKVINKVAVSVSLPQVWADVAAPPAGTIGASSGTYLEACCMHTLMNPSCLGSLNLLAGLEVGVAWLNQLKSISSSVHELVDTKQARDRKILLALLSNAARSTLHQKVHLHVHMYIPCNLIIHPFSSV